MTDLEPHQKQKRIRFEFEFVAPYLFTLLTIVALTAAAFLRDDSDMRGVLFLISGMCASIVFAYIKNIMDE